MKKGAFALVDCLGFKGIWKRANPDLVLAKLKSIEKTTSSEDFFQYVPGRLGKVSVQISLLSDTVAVSVQYGEDHSALSEEDEGYLVAVAIGLVINIISIYLNDEPALLLRGCISYGEHMADGNFIIGPAVDQAAEHMDIADGAFVWLLPSALKFYNTHRSRAAEAFKKAPSELLKRGADDFSRFRGSPIDDSVEDADSKIELYRNHIIRAVLMPVVIADFHIPLKGGRSLKSSVVNPLIFTNDRQAVIDKCENALQGDSLDVWVKRQNTLKFLYYADREQAAFHKGDQKL